VLRVVDVLNPKNPNLWLPGGEQQDLPYVLCDLLAMTGRIATANGLTLSAAITHTLHKNDVRQRKPRVLTEQEQEARKASGRDRLAINPFIGQLLVAATSAEKLYSRNK
jgi:hypothetical protein